MKNIVREPQQERSIEKKHKIIQAGYELFSEVGYYGTNTVEIAKRAGVSTGIVYGYFQDKRDILICALNIYLEKITSPITEVIKKFGKPADLRAIALAVVDKTIDLHQENAQMHNTLHALAATDEAVNAEFINFEDTVTAKVSEQLKMLDVNAADLAEKVHMGMNIVQSFAHEYVFDSHNYIDYSAMKSIVCDMLVNLFK